MAQSSNKKRKTDSDDNRNKKKFSTHAINTSKPSAVYQAHKGRACTVSVAVPGSIIANAMTHDLKTQLAGQIARALAVFSVDEVVIFNDGTLPRPNVPSRSKDGSQRHDGYAEERKKQDAEFGYTAFADPNHFLHHILSYLETPPNLRRTLFSHHPNLSSAGSLPSLDMPHHLRADDWCPYREGVTVEGRAHAKKLDGESQTTLVKTGLSSFADPIEVDASIPPNTRVTLKFEHEEPPYHEQAPLRAEVVSPDAPREEAGYYWGYTCRSAESLSKVITECEYQGGYDFCIGTSERGEHVRELLERMTSSDQGSVSGWKHLLVVFGGVAGLEQAVKADEELKRMGVFEPKAMFDAWINLVEGQGSRTIRTEESLWIGLAALRDMVLSNETRIAPV